LRILGAAIGSCVHVAGVLRFLTFAEEEGHETIFLGTAVPIDELIAKVKEHNPDVIGVSYRLTATSAVKLLEDLKNAVIESGLEKKRWILGCTAPIKSYAEQTNLFEEIFTGFSTDEDSISFLRGRTHITPEEKNPQDLLTRMVLKSPIPLVRHHFGLPSIEETIDGVARIAEAGVLDILSIGPDQNAQESFFRPSEMNKRLEGDGGVPIRDFKDLQRIFEASRRGNYPLMRCYSGTRDLISWAQLLKDTLNNTWGATPLLWYSELDRRSKRFLEEAITENKENHRWHAKHNIPVEINESHHWSLRSAHDTIAVAMAYLSAYNAKKVGVRHYIAQYMLNTPLGTSPKMDLAKMLAKIELIESLHGPHFDSLRQIRPGLFDHAATANDIIESCKISRRVMHDCLLGTLNPLDDKEVLNRKNELVREAKLLIAAIRLLGDDSSKDPLIDPITFVRAVKKGVLDAPHLRNNPIAKGLLKTKMIDGACLAIDPSSGTPIDEATRLRQLNQKVASKHVSS